MIFALPEWMTHNRADYVIAAYMVAALGLVGIGLASWCAYRMRAREWAKLTVRADDVR